MKCSKCDCTTNKNSYYCHSCGYQLKKKINGWGIVSFVLFIVAIGFVIGSLTLNSQLTDARNDAVELERQINNWQNQLVEKDSQIQDLNRQIQNVGTGNTASLQRQINILRTQLTERDNEIQRLSNQPAGQQTTPASNQDEIRRLTQERDAARRERDAARGQLQEYRTAVNNLLNRPN